MRDPPRFFCSYEKGLPDTNKLYNSFQRISCELSSDLYDYIVYNQRISHATGFGINIFAKKCIMRQNFTLITLGVKDFTRALAFYESLGWKKSELSQATYALFPLGGIVLGLYPLQELEKDITLNHQDTTFSGITISYNATSKEEVDAVMREVEKLGATVIKPAQNVFWGGYSGYFKDLDGYVFEVVYNPFWKIDDEGKLLI